MTNNGQQGATQLSRHGPWRNGIPLRYVVILHYCYITDKSLLGTNRESESEIPGCYCTGYMQGNPDGTCVPLPRVSTDLNTMF
jgi:hypothetical protein